MNRETGEDVINIFGDFSGKATYPTNEDMKRFVKVRKALPRLLAYSESFILRMDDDFREGFLSVIESEVPDKQEEEESPEFMTYFELDEMECDAILLRDIYSEETAAPHLFRGYQGVVRVNDGLWEIAIPFPLGPVTVYVNREDFAFIGKERRQQNVS